MTSSPDTATVTVPLPLVPEVGDIVRHQGRCHTVVGWLRTPPERGTEDNPAEAAPRPLLFATRANATHVRIRNHEVGPTVARLTAVEPTGERDLFARSTIRVAHRMAEELDGQPSDYYEPVPDIGDVFTRPGHLHPFVVVGWLKAAVLEPLPPELVALFADLPPREPPLVFCVREVAEFVIGYGVCGVVAPVGEVAVSGRVDWPDTHMDHARRRTASLVGEFAWVC